MLLQSKAMFTVSDDCIYRNTLSANIFLNALQHKTDCSVLLELRVWMDVKDTLSTFVKWMELSHMWKCPLSHALPRALRMALSFPQLPCRPMTFGPIKKVTQVFNQYSTALFFTFFTCVWSDPHLPFLAGLEEEELENVSLIQITGEPTDSMAVIQWSAHWPAYSLPANHTN